MHYGPYGFASDPYTPTIRTLERGQQSTIGQRVGPSFLDFQAVSSATFVFDHDDVHSDAVLNRSTPPTAASTTARLCTASTTATLIRTTAPCVRVRMGWPDSSASQFVHLLERVGESSWYVPPIPEMALLLTLHFESQQFIFCFPAVFYFFIRLFLTYYFIVCYTQVLRHA